MAINRDYEQTYLMQTSIKVMYKIHKLQLCKILIRMVSTVVKALLEASQLALISCNDNYS